MGENYEQIKKHVIKGFPKLKNDKDFSITSKVDPNYNCIAWALHYDNRWLQPCAGCAQKENGNFIGIEGFECTFRWPPEAMIPNGSQADHMKIEVLIKAFECHGFSICENADLEEGYEKVALYFNPSINEWTHAARQRPTGIWTSKLGTGHDIAHGTPYTIEGPSYGKVLCIMKKPFSR